MITYTHHKLNETLEKIPNILLSFVYNFIEPNLDQFFNKSLKLINQNGHTEA